MFIIHRLCFIKLNPKVILTTLVTSFSHSAEPACNVATHNPPDDTLTPVTDPVSYV
ncbi:hypothetical protein Hanom_Chr06g00513891 [Helianthus anomalus]